MRLEGKVAVVTGGSSGIGLAVARELRKEGARVCIFARDMEGLENAASTIGVGTLAVAGDVAKPVDLEKLFREVVQELGTIDIVIANAGVTKVAPVEQTDQTLFSELIDVNIKGSFYTVQKALPHLNKGASVVLLTAVSNSKGEPGMSVYAASKAAVRSLARSLSAELLSRGVRVNALSPGLVETPGLRKTGASEEEQDEMLRNLVQSIPMKRMATVEEVAKAALFLASDDSSYVAGAELVVDGGYTQI